MKHQFQRREGKKEAGSLTSGIIVQSQEKGDSITQNTENE